MCCDAMVSNGIACAVAVSVVCIDVAVVYCDAMVSNITLWQSLLCVLTWLLCIAMPW